MKKLSLKQKTKKKNYGKNDGTVDTGGKALGEVQNEMGGKRCERFSINGDMMSGGVDESGDPFFDRGGE